MEGYKTAEVNVVKVRKRNRGRKLGKQMGRGEKRKNEREQKNRATIYKKKKSAIP